MKKTDQDKIKRYYNDNQIFYRVFWMNKKNLAMHYGFWQKNTKNRHEALINENKAVADALNIKKGDVVLDAGCGVGGTAIWIAENYGAKVMGITLVEKQVNFARNYARRRKVDKLVDFKQKDFCKTGFKENSFDKIFAIEAVCHATDKKDFIKEAYRILKPGGELCIIDYFLNKNITDENEKKVYKTVCSGWALPDLSKKQDFQKNLEKYNFQDIHFVDHTNSIMKSAHTMSQTASLWLPIDQALSFFRLITDENVTSSKASLYQYDLFKLNIGVHGLFFARKPKIGDL